MNETQANAILSLLQSERPEAFTTTKLLERLDIERTLRWGVLKILHAAYAIEWIKREGSGNYRWRANIEFSPGMDLGPLRRAWYAAKGQPEKAKKEGEPAPKKKLKCECNGTGWWTNPRNAADKRPCFFCEPGKEAQRQLDLKRGAQPQPAPSVEVESLKTEVRDLREAVTQVLGKLENFALNGGSTLVKIEQPNGKVKTLENTILPAVFNEVLDLAMMRKNIMLVGPAGSGKTTIGSLVAQSLDLEFSAINCSEDMSASQIVGRDVPNLKTGESNYVYADFVVRFEDGGIFVLDEIDAANSNVLLAINSALSNGYLSTSKGAIKRHKDFICIATANTMGRGANRQYVGRNQLDAATLDRFKIGTVEVDYDERVEKALCPDAEIFNLVQGVRKAVMDSGIRQVVSTRFLADAYSMKVGRGWGLKKIIAKLLVGWTVDEKARVSHLISGVA